MEKVAILSHTDNNRRWTGGLHGARDILEYMPIIHLRRTWDAFLITTVVLGSAFIWMTRATPGGTVVAPPAAAATLPAPFTNHPAPDFTLTTIDGTRVRLSDLRGQVVLINIWATWCPPCRAEMPAIQAAYERFHSRGFTVLAVNQQEDATTIQAYLRENGLTFPALLDGAAEVGVAYQARALPSSFFVDRRGIIRAIYRGPMSRGVIDGTIEHLVAETP